MYVDAIKDSTTEEEISPSTSENETINSDAKDTKAKKV
jgi:hypothetical protein